MPASRCPDTKASTSKDIAAFVAKARAMSPYTDGTRGRLATIFLRRLHG
jgi:hypothetical protein